MDKDGFDENIEETGGIVENSADTDEANAEEHSSYRPDSGGDPITHLQHTIPQAILQTSAHAFYFHIKGSFRFVMNYFHNLNFIRLLGTMNHNRDFIKLIHTIFCNHNKKPHKKFN